MACQRSPPPLQLSPPIGRWVYGGVAQFPGADRVVRPAEDTVLRLDLQEWRTALNSRGSCSRGMVTILPKGRIK